jgi:hypothetical protein
MSGKAYSALTAERINRVLGVAKGHHHPVVRTDDRAGPAMGGFDPIAARDLDDRGIGHDTLQARGQSRHKSAGVGGRQDGFPVA